MPSKPSHASRGTDKPTQIFEPTHRYMPYEKIGRESATDILQQVDKILQSANTVLENHKDYLPSAEFAALKKAYCRYHWQMTNESQEDRAYYDKRIRESRILSQLYANRQTHQDRAQVLLYKVEAFQTKVLSASRNSHSKNALMLFEDELTESPEPPSVRVIRDDWFRRWVGSGSAIHRTTAVHCILKAETSGARSKISLAAKQEDEFIVSVTHFPKPPNESADSSETEPGGGDLMGVGNQIYRRMIVFENQDRRIEIIAESALQAMSELGQGLLSQSDWGIPSGSQITTDALSQTQSIETTIQKFKKLLVAEGPHSTQWALADLRRRALQDAPLGLPNPSG
ncbi:hypothetical protein AG1IA_05148 [Rhizoctonia solani AG-1 IA]|uniref:Uncharacterized protein n=1 Tax=Thanatephorus cucumeris (strain AG1-IA) TaxID=983506 RepID=L8WRU8_THACA|nr:hypothetical protein AG1IA_05148 [Rhizoctonia solani AG-1 IA]